MEVTDVRVGNLVYNIHINPINIEPCHFVEEDDSLRDKGDYIDLPVIRFFEPIPLTEEWLLRFGFKKRDDNYKMGGFLWSMDADNPLWCGTDTAYQATVSDNIKYVHQLQNLFYALTGEELELQ